MYEIKISVKKIKFTLEVIMIKYYTVVFATI